MYSILLNYINDTSKDIFLELAVSEKTAVLDKTIALKRVSGNEKLADDLLAMLVRDLPDYKQQIRQHHQQADKEALRKIIHKLHGGLRYVGAPALLEIVSNTDKEVFNLSDTQLAKQINLIDEAIDAVLIRKNY
jgi:two-component system sensor histidine kinase BarA